MFKTSTEAINWIESVKRFGDKLDLSRMEIACKYLNNPEKELNVIHVAGTNGKGSTVSYLKHILLEHGYHVGTYTSPYIVRFNERITYDNNDISDEELLKYINIVYRLHTNVLEKHGEVITFFELVTLISFLFFKDHPCDYVIYEVGLGGLLDATNVVQPIITAITTISFDHMGVLGNTLESIAKNKLGIVKYQVPLVTAIDQQELFLLFQEHTNSLNSELYIVNKNDIKNILFENETTFQYKNEEYSIRMLGTHQVSNASLALEILYQMENRNLVTLDLTKVKAGLQKTFWPGRLERFGNVYLDGAHNIGGASVLSDSIKVLFQNKKVKALFATMADKEYDKVIEILDDVVDEFIFTDFDYPRCEDAQTLYDNVTPLLKHAKSVVSKDAKASLREIISTLKKDEILLITGSLYFVSYMRKEF